MGGLVERVFGRRKYLFKLELAEPIPDTIYKERNLNIQVRLAGLDGQKVLNANMLHLCLGVVDSNGTWVTANRAGEDFMKGKTEVEMYHGEAAFLKVYPRDVSRSYPSGKLNFLIYAKPNTLTFASSTSSLEAVVDCSLIEPLLISDLSIRAKKKE